MIDNFGKIAEKIEKSKLSIINGIEGWEKESKETLSISQKNFRDTMKKEQAISISSIKAQEEELRSVLQSERVETIESISLQERKGHLYSLLNLILLVTLIIVSSLNLFLTPRENWSIPEKFRVEDNGRKIVVMSKRSLNETKDKKSVYFILENKGE